jgi:protein AATF/BFR2
VALGAKYRGARVSRDALDQSDSGSESSDYEDAREELDGSGEFDDPDVADLKRDELEDDEGDAEIDSDNAFGESDEERFKDFTFRGSSLAMPVKGKRVTRPTAADFMDDEAEESENSDGVPEGESEEEEEDEDESDELDGSDMEGFIDDGDSDELDGEEGSDESSDEEDEVEGDASGPTSSSKGAKRAGRGDEKEDLQALVSQGTHVVADTVAISMQKDIAKGVAMRQQRRAFDGALNIRIRLQKALVAVNSFGVVEDGEIQSEPYEAAEAAAVKLWNAIGDFRAGMYTKAGQKRKRAAEVETEASSQDMWDRMQETEHTAAAWRKHKLDLWSGKVKKIRTGDDANSSRNANKFVKVEVPLTMMLENQMQDPERLIKRTRTPRSCAPAQVAKKINEDPDIYDDADFYQLLLKELVDQRTTDTSIVGGQAATVRYAAAKEAKAKKHVDTKASKGRKLRFNVHEKLQNYMAPEDRRSWEQHAIDRFFGTLFGQKMVLNEEEDGDEDEQMGGTTTAEEEGLRLFRN